MVLDADFLAFAADELRAAVSDLIGRTQTAVRETDLPRSLARRAGRRLAMLEGIARRLIMLMALALGIEAQRTPCPRRSQRCEPGPILEPGVELVHFPRVSVRYLRLLPWVLGAAMPDALPSASRATGPVPLKKFRARIAALQRVLASPEASARRLARHLSRLRAGGEPAPLILGPGPVFRLSPELGLVATALSEALRAALKDWDTSP